MDRAECVVVRGERLLLVKHQHGRRAWWCLPGGGVLPGESPAQAALRELREECCVQGRLVRQLARVEFSPEEAHHSFLVEIGAQHPRLGLDPELAQGVPILVDLAWLRLDQLPERDRAFVWAAGLLALPEFFSQVERWGDQISYPE